MAKPPPKCIECKHHALRPDVPTGSKPSASDYICNAVFDVVTGEPLQWKCQNARGDQLVCGRDGKMFEVDEKLFGGV